MVFLLFDFTFFFGVEVILMGCGGLILVGCCGCELILVVLVIVVVGDRVDFGFLVTVVSDGWLIMGGGGFAAMGLWW